MSHRFGYVSVIFLPLPRISVKCGPVFFPRYNIWHPLFFTLNEHMIIFSLFPFAFSLFSPPFFHFPLSFSLLFSSIPFFSFGDLQSDTIYSPTPGGSTGPPGTPFPYAPDQDHVIVSVFFSCRVFVIHVFISSYMYLFGWHYIMRMSCLL